MISKRITLVAMALVGSLSTGLAQAQDADVQWSVTVSSGVGMPVYSQSMPVQALPMPAARPVPVYLPRGYQQPTRWDRDGDGIPNSRDRVFNLAWDRDGDGVANRYDRRRDDLRRDHDGDGVPNWRDSSPWGRR